MKKIYTKPDMVVKSFSIMNNTNFINISANYGSTNATRVDDYTGVIESLDMNN